MRPRHKAAENRVGGSGVARHPGVASMRPRHKAAENRAVLAGVRPTEGPASMRPRHKAAENRSARRSLDTMSSSFNEAAA